MWLKCSVLLIFALLASNAEGNCDMPGDKEWENRDFLFDVNDAGRNTKTYAVQNIKSVQLEFKYITWNINKEKTKLTFSVTPEFDNYIENEDTSRTRVKIQFSCADGSTKDAELTFDVEQTKFFEPEINKDKLEFDLKMPISEQTIIQNVAIKAKDINLGDMKLVFDVVGDCSDLFEFDATVKDTKMYSTHLKTKDKSVDFHYSISCEIQVVDVKGKGDATTIKLNVDSVAPNPIFMKPLYEATYKNDATEHSLQHDNIELEPTIYEAEYTVYSDFDGYFSFKDKKLTLEKNLPTTAFDEKQHIAVTIEATYKTAKAPGKTIVIINSPKKLVDSIPTFQKPLYTAQVKDNYNIDPIKIEFQEPPKDDLKVLVELNYKDNFIWDKNMNLLSSTKALPKETFDSVDYITVTIEAFYDQTKGSSKTVVIMNGPEKDEEQKNPIPVFKKPIYTTDVNDNYKIDPITIEFQEATKDNLKVEIETAYRDNFTWDKNTNVLSSTKALPKETFDKVDYITVAIEAFYDKTKGSGKTVVIMNGPEKDGEQKHPIPVFKKLIYTTDVNDNYIIDPITIEFQETTKDNLKVEIETTYKDNFIWDKNTNLLSSTKALPKEIFDKVDYITVTIEAFYDKTKGSGKTVVIMNSPEKDGEQKNPIPVFKKPIYTTDVNDNYKIDPLTIEFQDTTKDNLHVEVATDYKDNFSWDKNTNVLSSTNALPKETFDSVDYITVTIEAFYDKTKGSGKTVVIINGPEDDNDGEKQILVFENPFYRTQYKNDDSMNPVIIKLKSPILKPNFEIEPQYRNIFKLENDKFELKDKLPKDAFENVNYITVTIRAFYDTAEPSGRTVVIIDSPKQAAPKPKVWYQTNLDVFVKENTFTGLIGTFTAETESDEIVLYDILKTEPDIKDKLEYNTNGQLKVTTNLLDMPYFQITLRATGKESSSSHTMDVVLVIEERVNEDAEFKYSLVVESVPENSKQTKIVSASSKVEFKIADADSNDWFEIINGELFLKKNIDRENIKLKNMLKSQVKTKLEAHRTSVQKSSNISMIELYQTSPNIESYDQKCIDIQTIPYSRDIMYVVVTIEDENDNEPKFVENNPLTIGYPSPALAEFIAPPYLVQVTATDEDIGINAKIKYSVDKTFNIDAENGIIYPRDNLDSDTDFTVTATDRDGATEGHKTLLKIYVKILEVEHISVITVNNIAYSELDDLIVNLGKETNTKVKYLTSTALPKTESVGEEKSLRQTRADDKMPVLRIVMYALNLNDGKVVPAADFKKLIEESKLAESVDVKEYVALDEPSDDSGWVAAVSTLSVLLALVLIGIVAGYIFYLRPRLTPGGSIKYEKHTNNESGHTSLAPVETKIETNNVYARRPTGFPIGFTQTDLADDDDESDSDKDEKTYEEIDIVVKDSNEEQERRKSVVKFDTNVTEIEISEL